MSASTAADSGDGDLGRLIERLEEQGRRLAEMGPFRFAPEGSEWMFLTTGRRNTFATGGCTDGATMAWVDLPEQVGLTELSGTFDAQGRWSDHARLDLTVVVRGETIGLDGEGPLGPYIRADFDRWRARPHQLFLRVRGAQAGHVATLAAAMAGRGYPARWSDPGRTPWGPHAAERVIWVADPDRVGVPVQRLLLDREPWPPRTDWRVDFRFHDLAVGLLSATGPLVRAMTGGDADEVADALRYATALTGVVTDPSGRRSRRRAPLDSLTIDGREVHPASMTKPFTAEDFRWPRRPFDRAGYRAELRKLLGPEAA